MRSILSNKHISSITVLLWANRFQIRDGFHWTAIQSKQLRMGSYGIFHGSLSYHSVCGGLNPAQGYLFPIEKLREYSCFNSLCSSGPNNPGLTINPLKSCVCWPISAHCHSLIFYSLNLSFIHSNKGADGTKTLLSPVWSIPCILWHRTHTFIQSNLGERWLLLSVAQPKATFASKFQIPFSSVITKMEPYSSYDCLVI